MVQENRRGVQGLQFFGIDQLTITGTTGSESLPQNVLGKDADNHHGGQRERDIPWVQRFCVLQLFLQPGTHQLQ